MVKEATIRRTNKKNTYITEELSNSSLSIDEKMTELKKDWGR